MKKYIKIQMRNKENNITLPFEAVEQILQSTDQITMLKENGEWTGQIVNKSEIVATHRDYDAERDYNREKDKSRLLDEPERVINFEALGKLNKIVKEKGLTNSYDNDSIKK